MGEGPLRDLLVARSDCEWVLPLDDKDLLDPAHVEIGLSQADNADIIYSWCRVKELSGEDSNWCPNRLFNAKALVRHNYLPVTSLIRKSLLEDLGGFQHNNHWSLWARALKAGARFKCVPEVTWTLRLEDPPLEDLAIQRGAVQKPHELRMLIELIESREKPKCVLEIGTEKGGTLWLWCQLADPNALLVSVDLQNEQGYTNEDVNRILTYTRHQQKMQLFRGDSHDPNMLKSVERSLRGRRVDMLFIDGDHTLEGVTQDWETYSPLVRKGGIVVFHDIVEHNTFDPITEVKPLWEKLKKTHKTVEFCSKTGGEWGGIGVLFV